MMFVSCLLNFTKIDRLAKGSNASLHHTDFEEDSPSKLDDYRPTSLMGCIYKILVKLLALRLSKVMNSIISETQYAFMKGRNILDGVVVINEICDYARRRR